MKRSTNPRPVEFDDNDDYLYEEFIKESNTIEETRSLEEKSQEELQQELQVAINDIIDTIENEVNNNIRTGRYADATTNDRNTTNTQRIPPSPNVRLQARREPLFVQRRPYLSLLIRNLLVLDYFVVLLLFPFSLYNILRSGFSSVTFSETDFVKDILIYCKYVQIFTQVDGAPHIAYTEVNMDLLGKFHNIIIYYTCPIIKWALTTYTSETWLHHSTILAYEFTVKASAVALYLIYGVGATIYLAMAGFFFTICLTITLIRRYKSVHTMVAASLESSATLPGVF